MVVSLIACDRLQTDYLIFGCPFTLCTSVMRRSPSICVNNLKIERQLLRSTAWRMLELCSIAEGTLKPETSSRFPKGSKMDK